ncbi:Lrp/AsnC family transcriptional regulator [Novispirillum itersonii]|uniref:Lrp/AsnC family leucine-responsive transcriptional regulator n=1 Tax=Novispirillum itersonii TaxID=189 RepID=A0A7W9ZI66_NOVIT|nr:Lrp/AsnC family transcriptional regulator [Novispirillum itersonii]MBB6211926.1 Lrp/AsnC family leucine-responsive transcriptional regulator [Novispirillum itersonii]
MTEHDSSLDAIDRRILRAMQDNARLSNVELSEQAHLSPSQCHRRLKRLEELGVIDGYSARLNPEKIGLGVTAFVSVSLGKHGESPATRFAEAVQGIPEILECHSVSGEADYLLRVTAPDLKSFSDFLMHRLMAFPFVESVKSSIALECLKRWKGLPVS